MASNEALEAVLEVFHAKGVPTKKPTILIQPSRVPLDALHCDELQWWFLVPQPGNSAFALKYELETGDLDLIEHLACGGPARVHQTACLECTQRT